MFSALFSLYLLPECACAVPSLRLLPSVPPRRSKRAGGEDEGIQRGASEHESDGADARGVGYKKIGWRDSEVFVSEGEVNAGQKEQFFLKAHDEIMTQLLYGKVRWSR
jgi:hypothetical protein